MDIKVAYTGRYPNLCSGIWKIKVENREFNSAPYETTHFNTIGEYSRFFFDSDWDDIWENYSDGLDLDEWIPFIKEDDTNGLFSWLNDNFSINEHNNILEKLFYKIQELDFRRGSCGGCI